MTDYTNFEATNIKRYIIDQLVKDGTITDGAFIGSNMNAFVDVLATMLQQIQMHYSMCATETMAGSAVLWENMNKIVSLWNYKPSGYQSAILPVRIVSSMGGRGRVGTFTIPRYTAAVANKSFVLTNDLIMDCHPESDTIIDDVLVQGDVASSDTYVAYGDDYETVTVHDIYRSSGKYIADGSFTVCVLHPNSTKWVEFKEVDSLYTAKNDNVYDRRLNSKMGYDFKFGNGINGNKLQAGSQVVIFYVVSSGDSGMVENGALPTATPVLYNSNIYDTIFKNPETSIYPSMPSFIVANDVRFIKISATAPSSIPRDKETVEEIRTNLPKIYGSQNRLVTADDYQQQIVKRFVSSVADCHVMSNKDYLDKYLGYIYSLGIDKPNLDDRVLYNHVLFSTSCNFNNVYCVLLSKSRARSGSLPNYVPAPVKRKIVDQLDGMKSVSHNIVPIDPVYRVFDFGVPDFDIENQITNAAETKLVITRSKGSSYSADHISNAVATKIKSYFAQLNLGDTISIAKLSADLASIDGVAKISTHYKDKYVPYLTLMYWNPLYPQIDNGCIQRDLLMDTFMAPYFNNIDDIKSKLVIQNG